MLLLLTVLSIIMNLSLGFYPYTSTFQLVLKNRDYNPAISFMNLNKILNLNDKKNNLTINYYNNNQSIFFNYNTYSSLEDYKYSYKYLLRNNNTFLVKYDFNVFHDMYKYLIYIKSSIISPSRVKWDIYVKYNNLIINDKPTTDKIISKIIRSCIEKDETSIHPILINYFRYKK